MIEAARIFDEIHYISAGKLRRYHGESWLVKLTDVRTMALNLRDLFKLALGLVEAYFMLRRIRPQSMLLKGGFVCVPVSLAAKFNNVPYITHDSDAVPGLSNRIAARWSRYQATGMPAKYYNYPKHSLRVVGVPSDERFRKYSESEQRFLKEKYGVKPGARVLLVTGGSHGARRLNEAVIKILPRLLENYPNLHVLHQIGNGNEDQTQELPRKFGSRVKFFGFSDEIFHLSAVSDVIIARAGASAMADYAYQGKACIIVPNPFLTGGHQLRNAEIFEDAGAALVVHESELKEDPESLAKAVSYLLDDAGKREELAAKLSAFTPKRPAAIALADLVMEIAQ